MVVTDHDINPTSERPSGAVRMIRVLIRGGANPDLRDRRETGDHKGNTVGASGIRVGCDPPFPRDEVRFPLMKTPRVSSFRPHGDTTMSRLASGFPLSRE